MLNDWPRPAYRANGGDPFLFYVVYGPVDPSASLSRKTYRSNGFPDGIDVMHYDAAQQADVVSGFRENFLWDRFVERELELSARVAAATECVILRGTPADAGNLNYLRDTVGLITHYLDHGGLCVYDPQMFQWWTPDLWRERLFAPDGPVPRHHVIILTSAEDDAKLTWFHTRGMRKFGRPDLSVRNVPETYHERAAQLCNRLIEHQAFGATIPDGQRIDMPGLPDGMTCHPLGDLDDPDFNNVHIEIRWPSAGKPGA